MGQVVDIRSQQNGYVKILHKFGWEKGYKTKGKWNGFYESMGLLPSQSFTYYAKGSFKMGERTGVWELTFMSHSREIPIKVNSGSYIHGKREGIWTFRQFGKDPEEREFKEGIRVS